MERPREEIKFNVFNIVYKDFNNKPEDYMDLCKPIIDKKGKWMKFKNVWDMKVSG